MGNTSSSSQESSVLTCVVSYVAFVGTCVKRKGEELSDFVDRETTQSIHISNAIARRRSALTTPRRSCRVIKSPPLSARSKQTIADREDHLLLSARSIAIQKKAPLFRDTGEDEAESQPQPLVAARKLDINVINELVERDKIRRSIAF